MCVEGEMFESSVPTGLNCLVPRLERHTIHALTLWTMTTPNSEYNVCAYVREPHPLTAEDHVAD